MLASSAIRKGDAMLGHPCENSIRPSFGNTWDITQISFRSTEKSQTACKPRCQLYKRNSCKMSFWGKPSWFLCDPPDISSARRRGKIFLLLFLFGCPLPVVLLTGVRLKKRSWNITQLLKWNLSSDGGGGEGQFPPPTLLQPPDISNSFSLSSLPATQEPIKITPFGEASRGGSQKPEGSSEVTVKGWFPCFPFFYISPAFSFFACFLPFVPAQPYNPSNSYLLNLHYRESTIIG